MFVLYVDSTANADRHHSVSIWCFLQVAYPISEGQSPPTRRRPPRAAPALGQQDAEAEKEEEACPRPGSGLDTESESYAVFLLPQRAASKCFVAHGGAQYEK